MKIYILTLSLFASSASFAGDADPKAVNYMYGYAANQGNLAAQTIKKTVEMFPEAANQAGVAFIKGALEQMPADKRREIGADLAHGFIDKMNTPEGHDAAYKLGENVVKGAAGGAVIVAGMAKDAVIAKTVATAAAAKGAAIIAAPYVAGAAVVGYGGYKFIKYSEGYCAGFAPYKHCLNEHVKDPNCQMNDRGLPKRCESPERKMDQLGYFGYGSRKPILESEFKIARARLQAAKEKRDAYK